MNDIIDSNNIIIMYSIDWHLNCLITA
ncbi:MAG: hypothetical protein ACJAYV_002647, partial [Oleispira sp.]